MRVSVSLRTGYVVDDPRVAIGWMLDETEAARDAGLDGLYLGDHHATPVPYFQNGPTLGRLLAVWDDLPTGEAPRPVGALYLLPLWHPTHVAEQVGTLAALARGRFVLQCGIGDGAAQFGAMGASLRTRGRVLEHHLDVVTRLLAGETVRAEGIGGVGVCDGAVVSPRPADPVEVWIGGESRVGIERAARLGDAWYAWPGLTVETAREQLAMHEEACAAAGRSPVRRPLRRDVYVAADQADLDRHAGPVLARGHRGFPNDALLVGTVAQVVDEIGRYAALGFDEIVTRQLVDDSSAALSSTERLAEVRAQLA